jgi:hypothetical protein
MSLLPGTADRTPSYSRVALTGDEGEPKYLDVERFRRDTLAL